MFKFDLQYFGGRGALSGVPTAKPDGNNKVGDIKPWTQTPNVQNPQSLREALGEKGKPISMSEAVMGANPYYNGDYREFTENCQRAVIAYEARRRGYNVTAQPTFENDTMGMPVHDNVRWMGAFQGAKSDNVGGRTARDVQNNIESRMSQYGNGARGIVRVQWNNGDGAHVFSVERHNGRTYYVDPQIGSKYIPSQILSQVVPSSVRLVRTDNLRFSNRAMQAVEQAGSRTNG